MLTVVAFFAILVTGHYPRAIFGFNVGVLRWGQVQALVRRKAGVISVLLGVLVLVNLMAASMLLLGVLLGGQTVLEGVTVLVAGRQPTTRTVSPPRATGAPA